jgi:NAD+ synthase
MRKVQAEIIQALGVNPTIDPGVEVRRRVNFLKAYLMASGAKGLVLGISGGQDSSLAGRLSKQAVDELRAEGFTARFIAVRLPYGVQADEEDAQLALRFISPHEKVIFDVKRGVDAIETEYKDAMGIGLSDFGKGNVKARARMVAQYAIAGDNMLLVVGTDHAAEAVTGFFTKHGDGGADVLPLSGLTKRQGRALLKYLDAPSQLYLKEPTADLLDHDPGQPDEINLGLTYAVIDDYLEGLDVSEESSEAIELRYAITMHKRRGPVTLFDDWWL